MHTRKIRRYFILPILYIAIIFGLLFLQFSGTLTVRRSIGEIRFVGTLVSGDDETSTDITAARILFRGLEIFITEQDPLVLADEEGQDLQLTPVRYEIDDTAVTVSFADGSAVRFEQTEGDQAELHVLPEPSESWPLHGQMVLPYDFDSDTLVLPQDPSSPESVRVSREDIEYFISAPPRTSFSINQNRIFVPLDGTSRMIRYAEVSEEQTNIIEFAFGNGGRTVGDQYYQQTVEAYLDLGYRGWAQDRYNGGSGTWAMRDASPRFDEKILTAYLAESWNRGQYTAAFNQMRRAADLHPDEVGMLSAVYLGNLRAVTRQTTEVNRERAESLAQRVATQDPTVFRDEDLVPFSAYQGNEDLYRAVLEFVENVDYRTVEIPAAIGMLTAAIDAGLPQDATETVDRFLAIIEDRIYPAIRQFEEYFFVETAPGEIDVRLSIRAGDLIERRGLETENQLLVTIGRNLVLSGLQLADERGFLPALLFFNEEGIQGSEGAFGPEELYTFFSDNPAYPRIVPLYEQLGAGSYIWTIAGIRSINITAERYAFSLDIVPNQTQYVVIQGVAPFESMELFGLQWRNDPNFELYIKGRHYAPETETLMIKYTDDDPIGNVILFY